MKKINSIILLIWITTICFAQTRSTLYESYIETYNELAIVEQERHNIPASITLAQALLESSAGKSELSMSSNNHFGIKCHSSWEGARTYHDDDNKGDCFRKYDKVIDSYEDHSLFLKRDRYKILYTYKVTDYKAWAHGLKAAGYATDPNYAYKLIKIIEDYELHRFDDPKNVKRIAQEYEKEVKKQINRTQKENILSEKPASEKSEMSFSAKNMYPIHEVLKTNGVKYITAKANDNFKGIADEFGLTVKELIRFNELPKEANVKQGMKIYVQAKKSKSIGKTSKHVVQYNESMHSISQMYGIKMGKLYKINNLEKWSPVQVGMTLKLR